MNPDNRDELVVLLDRGNLLVYDAAKVSKYGDTLYNVALRITFLDIRRSIKDRLPVVSDARRDFALDEYRRELEREQAKVNAKAERHRQLARQWQKESIDVLSCDAVSEALHEITARPMVLIRWAMETAAQEFEIAQNLADLSGINAALRRKQRAYEELLRSPQTEHLLIANRSSSIGIQSHVVLRINAALLLHHLLDGSGDEEIAAYQDDELLTAYDHASRMLDTSGWPPKPDYLRDARFLMPPAPAQESVSFWRLTLMLVRTAFGREIDKRRVVPSRQDRTRNVRELLRRSNLVRPSIPPATAMGDGDQRFVHWNRLSGMLHPPRVPDRYVSHPAQCPVEAKRRHQEDLLCSRNLVRLTKPRLAALGDTYAGAVYKNVEHSVFHKSPNDCGAPRGRQEYFMSAWDAIIRSITPCGTCFGDRSWNLFYRVNR